MRVGDVGEADVLVPFQPGVEAAVVGPFVYGAGIGAFALPFEVHAPAGAVGVAGDQVVLVGVGPDLRVLILGDGEVARLVVAIQAQPALGRVLAHQPQADDAALGVHVGAEMGVRLAEVVPVGHKIGQHHAIAHPVVVAQQQAGAAAQLYPREQEAIAVALVGLAALEATAQRRAVFAGPDQREVFDTVIVRFAHLGQRVIQAAPIGAVVAQPSPTTSKRVVYGVIQRAPNSPAS